MQSDRSSNWYDVVVLSFVLDGDNATWARFFFSAMHKNFDDEASFSNHVIANLVIIAFSISVCFKWSCFVLLAFGVGCEMCVICSPSWSTFEFVSVVVRLL